MERDDGGGLQRIGTVLKRAHPERVITKRRLRKVESIECVRLKRETARQNLGFASRPFVLCGLPVRRPPRAALIHERRNGTFVLQVTGHPSYGLPWGQDRLVPIFLATQAIRQKSPRITFDSAAEMLDTFGIQQGGSQYRRLVASFQRVFGATIFFGTDCRTERAAVVHRARFNFMSEARIWYSRNLEQKVLPGECQNMIVLSDESRNSGSPNSDRPGSGEGPFVLARRARPVHMAFVPVFHRQRKGAHLVVWQFRAGESIGEHRVRAPS